ncbi:MAG: RNA methyltransferase [Planctomycetota bacterium]|nr:RNA methyltransferase [Planctomycetota bacterium]RLS38150.1 MAG: RNA methyltransferase [Planctomycetota bacterium]
MTSEQELPNPEFPPPPGLIPCRIVLVETQFPGNLGSVARVMRNMGLEDLVLVRPKAHKNDSAALRMAVHATEVLDNARVVDRLEDALADCVEAAATAARVEGPVRQIKKGFPRDILPGLLDAARHGGLPGSPRAMGKVAMVFGPEPSGLTTSDVAQCHHLIKIPSSVEYSSLNMAMAVGVCCYEARLAWIASVPRGRPDPELDMRAQELLYRHFRRALEGVGYLFGEKQEMLMHGIRHLLGRLRPTRRDAGMLHGLARQILWHVRTHPKSLQAPRVGPPGNDGADNA